MSAPHLDEGISVSVNRELEGNSRAASFWREVCRHHDVSWEFFHEVILARPEVIAPCVMLAERKGEPIALLVGREERTPAIVRLGYRTLLKVPARRLVFPHEGFMGQTTAAVAREFAKCLVRQLRLGGDAAARISNCPEGSQLYQALRATATGQMLSPPGQPTDHWTTSIQGGFEGFLSRRGARTRKDLRRKLNRFEERFGDKARYAIYREPEQIDAFCMAAEEVAKESYQRALGVGFLNSKEDRRRLRVAARQGNWYGLVLFVDDQPAAFESAVVCGETFHFVWTAYRPEFQEYNVGFVVQLRAIKDGASLGMKSVDFGIGSAAYKESLGDVSNPEFAATLYAPRPCGVLVRGVESVDRVLNRAARSVLHRFDLLEAVKRKTRQRLSNRN